MTAPVFLLRPLPDAARLTLSGPEGRHAATVRRLRAGERVDVTDGAGQLAECLVASVSRDQLELDVLQRSVTPPPQPRLVVVQALVKGERSELAVELLTEVGVDEIVPWAAERCVTRWIPERSDRRWSQAAGEAAKQARRVHWPLVADLATTESVPSRLVGSTRAYVLHEDAGTPLASLLRDRQTRFPSTGDVVIVVGPEGGLTDDEIAAFETAGAQLVRLGPTVLRASTAGCAAASVILAESGRWE